MWNARFATAKVVMNAKTEIFESMVVLLNIVPTQCNPQVYSICFLTDFLRSLGVFSISLLNLFRRLDSTALSATG
jgi:hypothetical protein